MVTVELHNLIVHGHHGIYKEERKVINTFEVNLTVGFDEKQASFEHIENTIDYVRLYDIVKKEMETPGHLLEKIGERIIRSIKDQYPAASEIAISIYKLQVPIPNFQGKAGVTMHRKFE